MVWTLNKRRAATSLQNIVGILLKECAVHQMCCDCRRHGRTARRTAASAWRRSGACSMAMSSGRPFCMTTQLSALLSPTAASASARGARALNPT